MTELKTRKFKPQLNHLQEVFPKNLTHICNIVEILNLKRDPIIII